MKTLASAKLLQKAIHVLSIIDEAESRIEGDEKEIKLTGFMAKDWRDELRIWPMGKPSVRVIDKMKAQKAAHEAAHKRLCKYYQNILSRLIDIS